MTDFFWILTMMAFCHVIEDFHIQGILADLKQRMWWKNNVTEKAFGHRYDNDYLAALLIHGFEWSFIVHIPLMYFVGFNTVVLASLCCNALLHAFIDDLKCNRLRINLIQDQLLHIVQISTSLLIIWGVLGP